MSNYSGVQDIFSAFVQGEGIFWTNGFSENKRCGVTNAAAQRLEDSLEKALSKAEEYKEMLIQAGVIQKEKTPEEIAKEAMDTARIANENAAKMAQLLESATQTIENLAKKVDSLEQISSQSAPTDSSQKHPVEVIQKTSQQQSGGKR